ncbi:hypothetical protein SUGI_0236220 [Cryptomeria japonica]|nr:hypothetical protein SUGI_0236220 [Cryptomeria japonica]
MNIIPQSISLGGCPDVWATTCGIKLHLSNALEAQGPSEGAARFDLLRYYVSKFIVQAAVQAAVANESRMAASLLRLHFHDCFVNGCDGSILLDNSSNIISEKTAVPNINSVRGFDVIDTIKSQVEAICSGVVSCADIVALAARDSVVALGGPSWTVPLGRRDSLTANQSGANNDLPPPTSSLNNLILNFSAKGLSTEDMIALSGAHTIGQARCTSFRTHIYNETNINSTYATSVQANCPFSDGNDSLSPLDVQTPTTFGIDYTQI